ncbi:glycosyltransferase family 4 protein [endosymbiont of unidentified scaly snail isolate Monju]|uniref:glycosyltransferase family 4 protein n=1 Tax=endosymbiont of unidentified scaly snail isolate Monju TaxID=1248727 RepID=UPI0003892887|nr:glycosyltransferase family 4 protein [endosymbiont of unidentified scaly snail isolate Monju]BAN68611.1 glycosyl transferase group 1 [endosymbiont of unidentified scaly snail isolate Monju]
MAKDRRLKVLVSAYTCSPYRGSEFAVGWGFVQAMAKRHDLWVIVEEEKCRADIERYLNEHPKALPNVRFFFLRKQRNRRLRRLWPPSYYWYYRRWHSQAFELAKKLHEEVCFDLAHQLTMVGFREPGYLWRMEIPFVWGPVGGMGRFPWRFLPEVGRYGALYYLGYNLYNLAQMRFMRRPRLAARRAGNEGLLPATSENREGAMCHWGVAGQVMPEVGLPRKPVEVVNARAPDEPLRIIWTGLHIPRKALPLGLRALARLPRAIPWELHVLGKGPRTTAWKRLASRLGIQDRCRFHGWREREAVLSLMAQGHLLLITSLRDLTSTVTVEALALGLPIVCLDHCGFAEVVNEDCGIKVPVTSLREVVSGIARALETLADDEPYRRRLAEGALVRAHDYDWDAKARVLEAVYRAKAGVDR